MCPIVRFRAAKYVQLFGRCFWLADGLEPANIAVMPASSKANDVLETERLRLEPLARCHAVPLFEALGDARIYRFIPEDPPGEHSKLEERYGFLEARRSPDGTQRWLNWAVRLRAEQERHGSPEVDLIGRGPLSRSAGHGLEAGCLDDPGHQRVVGHRHDQDLRRLDQLAESRGVLDGGLPVMWRALVARPLSVL